MTKSMLTAASCATLLWVGTALATPTAQQRCDAARITAWKVYVSCVQAVIAKDATGAVFDEFAAFAKCRHAYFKKWTLFQSPNRKPPLTGSTCIGTRFTDNSDLTVTDNLSGLVWEQKRNLDSTPNVSDSHDADNSYSWSTGSPDQENGTAFTSFLSGLNGGAGFAGANGWRLPTLPELQSIVLDFACTGPGNGSGCACLESFCTDPALDDTNTQHADYWTATGNVPNPSDAWLVFFGQFFVSIETTSKTDGTDTYVRAVRGGL